MRSIDSSAAAPVWDLPVRLTHWSIALLFALSWWSAEQSLDEVHFWSGHALLFLLVFRILWGVAGSSTARFAYFVRGPAAVAAYLRGGSADRAGHSPIGALSVVAMLLALIVQIVSGLIQIDEDDFVEGPLSSLVSYDSAVAAHDVHEASFNLLLALVGLHILAILYYRIRGRALVRAMIGGRAVLPDGVSAMIPAERGRLTTCIIAALIVTAAIVAIGRAAAG